MTDRTSSLRILATLAVLANAPVYAADGVKIDEIVVAASIDDAQRDQTVKAARAFYDFWNNGDENSLESAVASTFTDRTLPPGRPQGPGGPAFASRQFRGAVPDLGVTIRKMVVAGDYVTVHMIFTGHFTGTFGTAKGQGQAIAFNATDLIKIGNGRITDNWHIEDNLTLLKQMGVSSVGP